MTVRDALAHVEAGSCLVINRHTTGPVPAGVLHTLFENGLVNRWRDDASTVRWYVTPRGARVLKGEEAP